MVARLAFSLLLIQAQFPFSDVDLRRDIAETDKFAYFLGPSKPITSGKVVQAEWSGDDQYLAFQTLDKDGYTVQVWNRKAGRITKAGTSGNPIGMTFHEAARCLWLATVDNPATSVRIADSEAPGFTNLLTLTRLDLGTGRLARVIDSAEGLHLEVVPSPTRDEAIIEIVSARDAGKLMVYSRGKLTPIRLPEGTKGFVPSYSKGVPGITMYGSYSAPTIPFFPVDMSSGTLGAATKEDPTLSPVPPLMVQSERGKIGKTIVKGHWLKYQPDWNIGAQLPDPKNTKAAYLNGLIAADQKSAIVGPKMTAVAYWDRYNLFVREIRSMPHDEFEKAFAEMEKKALTDQAKQAGMAMLIYAGDADDMLPIGSETFESVFPYAKDSSIFDSFQFFQGGQVLTNFKNPAASILGRVNGRFGRAIVYIDGHVVWEPNL